MFKTQVAANGWPPKNLSSNAIAIIVGSDVNNGIFVGLRAYDRCYVKQANQHDGIQ